MKPEDLFYLKFDDQINSCLLALRQTILAQDTFISAEWKYGMPFFCYKGKMFCYLWVHKKLNQPYLGVVEGARIHHAQLLQEKRSRMKIMLFEADKDLPIKTIELILKQALNLYRNGIIKTPF